MGRFSTLTLSFLEEVKKTTSVFPLYPARKARSAKVGCSDSCLRGRGKKYKKSGVA